MSSDLARALERFHRLVAELSDWVGRQGAIGRGGGSLQTACDALFERYPLAAERTMLAKAILRHRIPLDRCLDMSHERLGLPGDPLQGQRPSVEDRALARLVGVQSYLVLGCSLCESIWLATHFFLLPVGDAADDTQASQMLPHCLGKGPPYQAQKAKFRSGMPHGLAEGIRRRYGWSLAFWYELRNVMVHDVGGVLSGRVFEAGLAMDSLSLEESFLDSVAKERCGAIGEATRYSWRPDPLIGSRDLSKLLPAYEADLDSFCCELLEWATWSAGQGARALLEPDGQNPAARIFHDAP